MNPLVNLLYLFILGVIHCIKWIEFQFLKLLAPLLRKKGKEMCENVGVILLCPDDDQAHKDKAVLSKGSKNKDSLVKIRVNDNSFFTRIANQGSLAFGETYMDKVWDWTKSPDDISQFISRTGEHNMMDLYWNSYNRFLESLELYTFNLQTKKHAVQAVEVHYNFGDDLYELMLDPWLQYTCGYWAKADNLNQAQLDKMELIAKKLDLKPGMKVLDIGCGWGTLCKYLAENYGVECVGVTVSKDGAAYGQRINANLPVDIRFQDYRDVEGQFDRVVSVGCMEHVGIKNHRTFFEVAHRCLKDDGIFVLHSIGVNHKNVPCAEKWTQKYMFPYAHIPKSFHITNASYGLFIIEDWHNFSADYIKTLHAWRENFINNWGKIEKKYGDRFYRMWIYYLSFSKGLFLSRRMQLWQVVFSKDGLQTGYRAPR